MPEHEKLLSVASRMVASGNPRFLYMACWLGRQSLETMVEQLIAMVAPGAAKASMRSKLAILEVLLQGTAVPSRAHAAWQDLSHTCHLPAYDLPPTALEVAGWLEPVEELAQLVRKAA